MNLFDAIIALAAFAVLFLGVVSGYVRNRLWISESVICLAFGAMLSPLEFEFLGMRPGLDEYLHLFQQVGFWNS